MAFDQRISRIPGLSDRRRLPRLGAIRLGIKVKNTKKTNPGCKCGPDNGCFKCSYPKETDYFVCPPEVQTVYGEKPKELDVMLPINDAGAIFPTAYKHYGSGAGLKCHGDGQICYKYNEAQKDFIEDECPCDLLESGKCKQSGTLMAILPKVSMGGCYFIRTGSFNSIVDINSGLEYVQSLIGRFNMIPLKLKRVKTQTHHDGKKQNHYTLQIVLDATIDMINHMVGNQNTVLNPGQIKLPAPETGNPAVIDPCDVTDEEDETGPPEDSGAVEPEVVDDGAPDSETTAKAPKGDEVFKAKEQELKELMLAEGLNLNVGRELVNWKYGPGDKTVDMLQDIMDNLQSYRIEFAKFTGRPVTREDSPFHEGDK